jgi:signal transduction histidine kinase
MTHEPEQNGSSDRRPIVLLAEDDPMSADMLETLLHRAGYDVRVAPDGAAALQSLEEESPTPDVMLLDWMLPKISGLKVCQKIRERYDHLALPILMVTAKGDLESVSSAFECGASDYITKPFHGAELRARLAAHLRIKQLSDERQAIDEHLAEREKLSTLGLLVSGVAHDLNNPLGGIYGYAQLLLEQERDPERLIALERIVSEVQRCNRIVAELLTFARRHARERSVVMIDEVLSSTLAMRERHLQSHGLFARIAVSPEVPKIFADAHQLQQVFLNIVVNAEHALRERGTTLRITAERTSPPGGIGRDWVAVRFYNDGPPIPAAAQPRIFDPFFTTKGKDEGTGLGLAICRRIVREHGGDIYVESGLEGTTFTLLLPGVDELELVTPDGNHAHQRLAS